MKRENCILSENNLEHANATADRMAADGWQLMSVHVRDVDHDSIHTMAFYREVAEEGLRKVSP